MEKLKDENVSLDFTVQSLIKERDNVKLEYQKLFNSIKKTRSQTQTKLDELIAHVFEKTYAYGVIRAENQNLFFTISELKTRLANIEKGMNVASSVRRPMNRDSHVKNSVLANSKKPAKKVAVYVRKNKQTDITSENVISNKENVIDVDVANASKAKTLLLIIMAQQQHAAEVHPDELCPPNKRYDLMDANKKVDLEHVQCPPESKILMNIIKNHPLRFSIAASSSVPWIYMAQFWHTLKEDGSKYRLKFMLDKKELSLTLDDFRTIFHLPQANDNNHNSFVPPPSFFDMVPFYKQQLGFTMELKTSSSFKTTGLLQPWQTLCKIFSKCLTTRVTGWDQPPLQIMQMMYCFVNNIHVDYAELLWEGLYYSLHHPTSSIPYPRFTKIIISHYQCCKYRLAVPRRMYAKVFGLDVPLTQSQPTESTQETHRTPSAPRSPNPKIDAAESSAPKQSTVISTHNKVSLAESQNDEKLEAKKDVELVSIKEAFDTHGDHLQEVDVESLPICSITNTLCFQGTQYQLYLSMKNDPQLQQQDIAIWLALQMKFENLQVPQTTCRPSAVRPRDQDDFHDDAHPEGENSAKRQKTSEYEAYMSGESSSGQVNEEE
ncbi:hypothetical protein Tco_1136270 [Tanacetum coccineum]